MNANYAEIYRVGNLETKFQQVPLVQFFWIYYNIVVKHQQFQFTKEKKKILGKNKKKSHFTIEIA